LLLPALYAVPAVAAADFQNLDQLEVQVIASLGAGIGEPGGPARPIDRRLKLSACPSAPVVSMPFPATAAVRCDAIGWRIHVPLVRTAAAEAGPRVKAEPVIRKGDQVEVVAEGGTFVVSVVAVAQQDGAPGERIRFRSDEKAAPFVAQVEAPGRAVVSRFD
jgi:flagella basal body P-ring formation protein FlgA